MVSKAPQSGDRHTRAALRQRPRWLAPDEQPDPFARRPSQQPSAPSTSDHLHAALHDADDGEAYEAYDETRDAPVDTLPPGPQRLTLPSIPALPTAARTPAQQRASDPRPRAAAPARDGASARQTPAADAAHDHGPRLRGDSTARPLSLIRPPFIPAAPATAPRMPLAPRPIPTPSRMLDHTPALAAYRSRVKALARPHVATRALLRQARSPWNMIRALLVLLALTTALWTAGAHAGEPSQPLMARTLLNAFVTQSSAADARMITTLVRPETQGMRPDLYDSYNQFNDWWDAACSAAVMSEVLTAWSVPHTTIGRMIDVMQPDISLDGGLLTPHGFERGAAAFNFRADINWHLTYKQMLYITNTLGLPIIVNVRISYGYYHFFSGGHFLVMTGGDDQGLQIVDSSEYYIKYLPIDTFMSMFTGMTAVVVPSAYQYSPPTA